MAGRVLKITLEGTHPPIWRRAIIPDRITFRDLHDIIQILFGWYGYHLHSFENYKQGFCIDCLENPEPVYDLDEDKTLVDDYIEALPWIRYTYDFGDDWMHKIMFEKYDPSYELRHATLLKYKGDNPVEDCGGVTPWMELTKFDPEETILSLEQMEIPARKTATKKGPRMKKNSMNLSDQEIMEAFMNELFDQMRKEMPMLKDASDDELMDVITNQLMEGADPDGMTHYLGECNDPEVQRQIDLLEKGSSFTIVQSRKKMQKNLALLNNRTIADYMKYSRFASEDHDADCAKLADYITEHADTLFYFFYRDEMEGLLSFWDYYKSGHKELQGEYLSSIAKACSLGLIKVTGKRKLKLELCAEFGQVMDLIQCENIDYYYDQIDENVSTIGMLLMAYTALSLDQFYEIYSACTKHPLERNAFEKFIYWNGTMNHALTTFYNSETSVCYLTLPDMQHNLYLLESIGMDKLFKVAPRDISDEELGQWRLGFNAALPEWGRWVSELEDEGFDAAQMIFENYMLVAAGATMTELVMHDLMDAVWAEDEMDEMELSILESEIWHTYADVCLATPLLGLNGYSREQYARTFHEPLDFIPLFDKGILSKRVNKHTHIFELPREIQLDMLEALRKGKKAYRQCIERLCRKYKSNQALLTEQAWILSDTVSENHPEPTYRPDNQKIVYPWGMDGLDLPKPETYVRENKKIGRNDPCPCGSGKKYKHCCGK